MEKIMSEQIKSSSEAGALLGMGEKPVRLLYSKANRHGLIAGATGTGKTVTLKVLAENFSRAGIPVLITDIKGDISSISKPGLRSEKTDDRLIRNQIDPQSFEFEGYPVRFFDVYREQGIAMRASISDLGPSLLSRLLELSEAQQGILNIIFKAADEKNLELTDYKDLKSMVRYAKDHREMFSDEYGNVSAQSISALQRKLLEFENQNAEQMFGLPAFDIRDLFETRNGYGLITLIECSKLYMQPLLYSSLMLWLLSELYEQLPEAGDLEKPRIVLFIDEAHLLFDGTPKVLRDRLEQMIRLIRSKGVGIYLVSQSPSDIPDEILAQLGNRIQHALHAYTPAEMKKAKAAAAGFRTNPNINTLEALQDLKTGEALISILDEDGAPSPVQRVLIMPPRSSFDALNDSEMMNIARQDPAYIRYHEDVDPITAYEKLEQMTLEEERAKAEAEELEERQKELKRQEKESERNRRSSRREPESALSKSMKKAARSAARSAGRETGKAISRGLLKTSSGSARRAAERAAGSLLSDLFSSFFR